MGSVCDIICFCAGRSSSRPSPHLSRAHFLSAKTLPPIKGTFTGAGVTEPLVFPGQD